jgi:hypothetical protein
MRTCNAVTWAPSTAGIDIGSPRCNTSMELEHKLIVLFSTAKVRARARACVCVCMCAFHNSLLRLEGDNATVDMYMQFSSAGMPVL